jgi:hypothetical protein
MTPSPDERSNPFATRFIRPGAIEYIFPPGLSAESLVADLERLGWRGSILGPHGTGKSSLLVALTPALEQRDRKIVHQQLQGGQRSLDWPPLDWQSWTSQTLVIVDGYEQLSLWQRTLLGARCYQREAGLLITAHEPVRLPALFTTKATPDLAQQIVRQLLPAGEERVTAADVAQALAVNRGNIREMLLGLFDVYRQRS